LIDALRAALREIEALCREIVRLLEAGAPVNPLVLARALVTAELTRRDLVRMARELADANEEGRQ